MSRSLQRVDTGAVQKTCVSQVQLDVQVNPDTNAEIAEYAELHDLSKGEASKELLRAGLRTREQTASSPPATSEKQVQLEQRQQSLAHQQQQIIQFQKRTVMAGIGWAVLTVATGVTGPLWTALGMLIIVLMAASTYSWQLSPI